MKNSVKNILAGSTCAVVAAAIVIGGVEIVSANRADKNSITSNEAVSLAFEDAGLNSDKAYDTKSTFELEDGKEVYEVEFDSNGNEYDYIIEANSGNVIEKKVEKDDSKKTEKVSKSSASNNKGIDVAKEIAVKDAGLKMNSVQFTKAKIDNDDGREVYEIEFVANGKEYEYEIDVATNKIIDKNVEILKAGSVSTTKEEVKQGIDLEKAKQIALSDAGLSASKVKFVKAKADYDDGIKVFDIEFISGSKEYEYEINATSGRIIDKHVKPVKESKDTSTTKATTSKKSEYISVDSAKNKALSHAGFKSSEVKFIKAVLDNDDGVSVYEIEFINGKYKYDYEINASTGKIVDWEKEIAD